MDSEALSKFVAEAGPLLGLPIAEAFRPGVVANLDLLLRQAALVMALPLPPSSGEEESFLP